MATVPSIGRAAPPEAASTQALYERYAVQIFRYCLHQLGSREEAEDAVQSTFLNAFRGLRRGIVPELESAWLFKIAHNVCLSRRRSTWRRGRIESPADFELVGELAPAPSRRTDELIGLQDVLEGMPEQQRRAILLREWQGLSYREIAEELDLSQSAVETLIFRARRSLAAGLEQPAAAPARRRRSAPAGALGNLLSAAQSWLLGGGAAVKVAATVAAVGAGTVVATAPVQHHRPPVLHVTKPAVARHGEPVTVHRQAPVSPVVVRQAPVAPAPVRHARPAVRHASVAKRAPAPAAKPKPAVAVAQQPVETAPPPPVETVPPSAAAKPGPPVAPPAAHGRAQAQHGRATAPGRVKKQQPSPAPATPAPVAAPAVQTTPAEPQAPAADPANGNGANGNGNGNGNGNAYGRDTPHGNSGK